MYTFGSEFMAAAEKLEQERSISASAFINAICDAVLAAYKRKVPGHNVEGVKTVFHEDTCQLGIFAPLTVVEQVENEFIQISFEEAKAVLGDVQLGEILEVDVTPEDFSEYGRIAAQAARQMMRQRLSEEEKKLLRKEFDALKNTMIVGQVSRLEERHDYGFDVVVDLGRIEAVMPPKEQIPGQEYKKGQRVRCYVSDFQERSKRMIIIVSQAHEELLLELFRLEVPEVEEGIVEIVSASRIAGKRSKVAVRSNNSDVDPIGACIGSRGARIQNISSEIYNEKIDVIPWSEDPIEFISYALSPTQISQIALFDDNRALIVVPEDQLSLAIGKGGQNVKLATKLTGWKLDIRSEDDVDSNAPQGKPINQDDSQSPEEDLDEESVSEPSGDKVIEQELQSRDE
ncbi:MAG: transcription termination factor NusA [Candidatus Caenarcaniphilales bacterium]|nr:transcription termination factor NusA [Candidatus Caenarcaniphilales bacterium]